jgi:hypothetical protein
MQGTPENGFVLDIDALLAERKLEPVPFRLGGKTYKLRTNLSVKETNQVLALVSTDQAPQAMTILVGTVKERADLADAMRHNETDEKKIDLPAGKTGQALSDFIDTLPRLHQAIASANIYRASKALADFAVSDEEILRRSGMDVEEKPEGESQAS